MSGKKIYIVGIVLLIAVLFGGYKLFFDKLASDQPKAFAKYNGSIVIGMEENYRPFSYLDDQGNLVGFDHDLSLAICQELNLTCELRTYPFPSLQDVLKNDEVQVVVAGLSITPERQKVMAFSDPYYHSLTHFISNNPKIGTMRFDDPGFRSNIRVGVQDNSMQYDYIAEKMADYPENIFKFPGYEQLAQALLNHQVDIVLLDGFAAFDLLNRDPAIYSAGSIGQHSSDKEEIDTLRIAVDLKNEDDVKYINYALSQLRQRGEYQRIAAQYFPFLSE